MKDDNFFSPEIIIKAYSLGIFPMAKSHTSNSVSFYEPSIRGIIPLNPPHIPRKLLKMVRKSIFEITINYDFRYIIDGCSRITKNRKDTWINKKIKSNYLILHKMGFAHSIEVWDNEKIVGGLYGLSLGSAFFGESMFSPEAKRTATVQAMEPCIVAVFTLESYQDFVHQDSATATQYSEYFRAVLHARKERNKGLYYVDNTKYLALIAHNEMKESLMEFAKNHINEIEAFPLVATGTTGQRKRRRRKPQRRRRSRRSMRPPSRSRSSLARCPRHSLWGWLRWGCLSPSTSAHPRTWTRRSPISSTARTLALTWCVARLCLFANSHSLLLCTTSHIRPHQDQGALAARPRQVGQARLLPRGAPPQGQASDRRLQAGGREVGHRLRLRQLGRGGPQDVRQARRRQGRLHDERVGVGEGGRAVGAHAPHNLEVACEAPYVPQQRRADV